MSQISRDDVLKLAKLSRLELTDAEINLYRLELEAIFSYIEMLGRVNTEGIEPTYQVSGLANVMRPDEIIDYGTSTASLLKNAPLVENGMFRVGRMVG